MVGLAIKDRLGAEGLRRLVQGEHRAKVRVRHLAIAELLEGGTRGSGGAIGMPHINLAAMNQHLAEISPCVKPGVDALLMIDGAGWHGDAGLVVRANMTGRYLPVPPGTQFARNKKAWFSAADRVFGRDPRTFGQP